MKHKYTEISERRIREELRKLFCEQTFGTTDLGGGIFKITAGKLSALTTSAGIDMFNKAVLENYEKMNKQKNS